MRYKRFQLQSSSISFVNQVLGDLMHQMLSSLVVILEQGYSTCILWRTITMLLTHSDILEFNMHKKLGLWYLLCFPLNNQQEISISSPRRLLQLLKSSLL